MKYTASFLLILLLSFSALLSSARAQDAAAEWEALMATPLPADSSVRIDTLENGLVYYFRANAEPAGRVELRLAVDAGSVLEEEDQLGLAHFVEHMLFNGTRRFQEQELVNFFERAGMRFGPDVNAYTSFDETVYMLQLPTDSSGIVRRGFEVLQEWAHYATLDGAAIEEERGVVLEEWRRGRGTAGRIRDKVLPVLLGSSRYGKRLPIGDTLVLLRSPPEALRRFYHRWYRPDLMAAVVVGDVTVDSARAFADEFLASLPNPEKVAVRPRFEAPATAQSTYKIVRDAEYPVTTLEVHYSRPATLVQTVGDYRKVLIGRLMRGMLNRRLGEVARAGAPFLWARASAGRLVRPKSFFSLSAQVPEDSTIAGLEALMAECLRALHHGFTESELARQKDQLLRLAERRYDEKDNATSGSLAARYVAHYLRGSPIPSATFEYDVMRRLLPGITAEEVRQALERPLARPGRAVVVTMPEKPSILRMTEQDLARSMARAEEMDLAPYVDHTTDAPLLAFEPVPGTVVEALPPTDLGIKDLVLSNGIRLVLKPTDFKHDEVLFTAFSTGGTSLAADADYFDATVADMLVRKSGVGIFDQTALSKKLAGKLVNVAPYISELGEGLSGSGSPGDLESLFQLIYLYVTQPRMDSAAVASFQQMQRSLILNRQATPAAAFQDSLNAALYGDHPRRQVQSLAQIDSLDPERALAFYRDRFADTDDFTFVFVGSFDPDTLTAFATTYLASLPRLPRTESWRNVEPDLPSGAVTKVAVRGQDPQSQVGIIYHGPLRYSRRNLYLLRSLRDVANMRLREVLREELGGTYSASVQYGASSRPDSTYSISVFFGCAPERAQELSRATLSELARLSEATDAELSDYVQRVQQQHRRARETDLERNSFWLGALRQAYEDPEKDLAAILHNSDLIDALTPQDIRQAASAYLGPRYVAVTLLPESDP